MNAPSDVLAQFDREMRIHPPAATGVKYESEEGIVREVSDETTIIFHDLPGEAARRRIEGETLRAGARGHPMEWKVYGHDRPPEMPRLLAEAGFEPDPLETLLIRDLVRTAPATVPAGPFTIRRVEDARDGEAVLTVHRAAFGPEDSLSPERFRSLREDPAVRLFVAYDGDRPVATGRLDLPGGRTFAGLWGGGTVPEARHRGAYRALVEARARFAEEAGFRYLTVEARGTSRPTLERMGFEPKDQVQGWRWKPGAASRGP